MPCDACGASALRMVTEGGQLEDGGPGYSVARSAPLLASTPSAAYTQSEVFFILLGFFLCGDEI